jgi:hypothetical protein
MEGNSNIINNGEIKITGIWGLFDVDKMCNFLSLPQQKTMNYSIKIDETQRRGYVYFLTINKPIIVNIIKKDNNKFELKFNGKSRSFIVLYNNDTRAWYWHFDDSCKQPPIDKHHDCSDGALEEKDINKINKVIESMKNYDRNSFEGGDGGQEPTEVMRQYQSK